LQEPVVYHPPPLTMGHVQHALVAVIFLATLGALYLRPFGARDWQIAAIGGLASWAASPLSLHAGVHVVYHSWNILAFFLGLMLIAAGAEASGLYERAAALLAGQRAGRPAVAAVLVFGSIITAILSNDATPLVLTPAIFAAARTRKESPIAAAFAATFVADGASLLLPISNPVNLLFYDRFDLRFHTYAATILPAAIAGIAALALVTWLQSNGAHVREVPVSPSTGPLPPAPVPILRAHTVVALTILSGLCLSYVAAAIFRFPLGVVSLVAGLAMKTIDPQRYRRHLSPGLLVFVAGLLLLVGSVSAAGLLDWLATVFEHLADQPPLVAIIGAAAVATVISNIMNNWPAALLLAATIAVTPGQPRELVAGALIGCTIGANFTMVGSLSTVFWLSLARKEGASYTLGMYRGAPSCLRLLASRGRAWSPPSPFARRTQPGSAGRPRRSRRS
jgi:arsenical pump membrane protein